MVAGLGYTMAALLMILMGRIGTLSGALVGTAVYRPLEFYLDRWFDECASFLLGLVYVGLDSRRISQSLLLLKLELPHSDKEEHGRKPHQPSYLRQHIHHAKTVVEQAIKPGQRMTMRR